MSCIDPSRMYLPPRIDSVASSGFGQIDASNNFGGNGYGEISIVQDTFAKESSAENSNYGTSTTTTNGLSGVQITGSSGKGAPDGSSSDQSSDYDIPAPGGNNFGGRALSSNNNEFNGPNTSNYGSSTMIASTLNNDFATQTGNSYGYGQNELLNTVQNQNSTKNNFNEGTEASQFGVGGNRYDQGTTTARKFSNVMDASASKPTFQDNRSGEQNSSGQGNNGNFGSSGRGKISWSNGGFGNVSPNSLSQTFTSGAYNNGNAPSVERSVDNSYGPASIDAVGFSSLAPNIYNQNNPSTSRSNNDISNGNYGQNGLSNSHDFRAEQYNQGSTSQYEQSTNGLNQGQSSSVQSYGENGFGKPNSDPFTSKSKDFNLPHSQTPSNTVAYEQKSNNPENQKLTAINTIKFGDTGSRNQNTLGGNTGLQSGTTSPNLYDQTSTGYGGGFNKKSSANYESRLNLNPQKSLQVSNNYEQSGSQSTGNSDNYEQTSPVTNQGSSPNLLSGYDQGSSSISLGGINLDRQNQPLSNNYGQSGPGPLANERNFVQSTSNGGYNGPNDVGQNQHGKSTSSGYGQTESQISSSREKSVSSHNGGYSHGGSLTNSLNDFERNTPPTPQASLNNFGSSGSQTHYQPKENFNQNLQTNCGSHNSVRQKSYEERDINQPTPLIQENLLITRFRGVPTFTPERNTYAQIDIPQQKGEHDQNGLAPTANERSPAAPGNFGSSLDHVQSSCSSSGKENNEQNGQPSLRNQNQKKHSTLVPKDQYLNSNLPIKGEFGKQGTEAYNYSNNNGDFGEPGLNAFSNFAPSNQQNQPTVNPSYKNCGTNSNQGLNSNKQTEAIFPSSNIGY